MGFLDIEPDRIALLIDSPVIWCQWALALLCYSASLSLLSERQRSARWYARAGVWQDCIGGALSALPLLGLLGTIAGLLRTFQQMSLTGAQPGLWSQGIATALVTTEMGLVLVVPGWLLLAGLSRQLRSYEVRACVRV